MLGLANSALAERIETEAFTFTNSVTVNGPLSATEPTSPSNVVTKAYGDANYGGGGGTVTSMIYHLDYAASPQNMSDQPLIANKTNSMNSMVYKVASFDKDQRLLSGFWRFTPADNWSSNLVITSDMFTEGNTNLTSAQIWEWHQGGAIVAGTGTTFTIPSQSISNQFRVTDFVTLTGANTSKDLYIRVGQPETNAANGFTRSSTLYPEGASCEFLY